MFHGRIIVEKISSHGIKVAMVTKAIHCSASPKAIQFHPSKTEYKNNSHPKPVVVLFGWLLAKSKHLEKYGGIYQNYGADIMTVQLEVSEVLRPKKAQQTAIKVLEKLISPEIANQPIFVHGFSVGGYMYSQFLNQVVNTEEYNPVKNRIIGQIFDSPVDFQGIPHGVSNAATKNPILRMLMKNGIESYLSITSKYTSRVFRERSELFHNIPVHCPSLFLFSKSDEVCDEVKIKEVTNHWKTKLMMDVSEKCWDTSAHVSHFYAHRDEYTNAVDTFFKRVMNY